MIANDKHDTPRSAIEVHEIYLIGLLNGHLSLTLNNIYCCWR
jgi:hypothetical protein